MCLPASVLTQKYSCHSDRQKWYSQCHFGAAQKSQIVFFPFGAPGIELKSLADGR